MSRRQDALDYHRLKRPGKIEVVPSKPVATQRELSLAYTPGVAEPCREIARDPDTAYDYTARGNLVAVVTNGTAVLGLGAIGALAAKPVMEGKAVLFKRFADIDVFDLEVAETDPQRFIEVVAPLEPTFGGINLEDIRSPDCFVIERELQRRMDIPVFHDDQHGTAIISGAALLNGLELVEKRVEDVRVVFSGAGAAGIACAEFYVRLGVRRENVLLCDSQGVVYRGRDRGMDEMKQKFAADTRARTLAEALKGADVFVGLSKAGVVTPEMLRGMAPRPLVFAMANPDPEIGYEEARGARPDAIVATGRSDFPNQVNNVLGFPFIFRGALDCRARAIDEGMKVAAARALAALAHEDVPAIVGRAYDTDRLAFGPEYIIPKPFDARVLWWVAPAVAEAAAQSGVARAALDRAAYRERLKGRLGLSWQVMRSVMMRARRHPKRIVFPEGEHDKILRASEVVRDEGIAVPILMGEAGTVRRRAAELDLDLDGICVVEPWKSDRLEHYVDVFHGERQRKGVTRLEARRMVLNRVAFGAMMVREGDADGMVAGIASHAPDTLRPALKVLRTRPGVRRVSGLNVVVVGDEVYFFADTTVNPEPSAEDLAEIALLAANAARRFGIEPRVALVSFSNFGSVDDPRAERVAEAARLVRERDPELEADGEMQLDTALDPQRAENYPFSRLKGKANVIVFPSLEAGNIAFKLMQHLGGATVIGPVLMGVGRPIHALQKGFDVEDIVNMTAIAVLDAQERSQEHPPAHGA